MRPFLLAPAALLLTFVAACTTTEVKTTPQGEQPGSEETPGDTDDATPPSDEEEPKDEAPKPPSVKLDTAFTAIVDSKNDIYAATPGANGATYVTFRKAGGAVGWGKGTLLRRYLASGTLDTTFATQGLLDTTLVANPRALGVDSTGRILVGGTGLYDPETTSDTGREVVVVRVTSGGTVDTTYGSAGRAKLSFSSANVFTTSLRVRADGGLLVNVYGRTSGNETYGNFLVSAGGTAVPGYGTAGFKSSPFPTDGALATGDDVLVPTSSGLARFGADGAAKGTAIKGAVLWAKKDANGGFTAVVSNGKSFDLARFDADGKKDASFVASAVSERFADFVPLADGSVFLADGGAVAWIPKTGGASTVVIPKASATSLATTADGKLLVTSESSVQRYIF